MATMNRAQYIQLRNQMRTMRTLAQQPGLAEMVTAIDNALAVGPIEAPEMWTDGRAQLVSDRELFSSAMAFAKGG